MANAYSVDKHPKKNAIIRDLVNQIPYTSIAEKYGMPVSTVFRYATQKLRHSAAKALKKGEYDGERLLARIEDTIVYVQKMYEACNDWLEDPEDHSKYNLDPRATELKVIYLQEYIDDMGNTKTYRMKEPLQDLLDKAMNPEQSPIKVETKIADPRNLVLQTAQTLDRQLNTLAKIAGVIKDEVNVDINVSVNTQLVSNVIQVIQREIDDPEIVQRIVEGISRDA
ncbi:MAG: hypothetical protein JXK93_11505 [Sphaerochaetaceae bacterium]|nr:hypothetical protein [Sphaerochaetaceae bacterium]